MPIVISSMFSSRNSSNSPSTQYGTDHPLVARQRAVGKYFARADLVADIDVVHDRLGRRILGQGGELGRRSPG